MKKQLPAFLVLLLITLIGMLPPLEIDVENPFVETHTLVVSPDDPSETTSGK